MNGIKVITDEAPFSLQNGFSGEVRVPDTVSMQTEHAPCKRGGLILLIEPSEHGVKRPIWFDNLLASYVRRQSATYRIMGLNHGRFVRN